MANSSKVTFALSGTTIQVEGPDGAGDIDIQPQWVTDQTADLTRIAYRTTSTVLTTWKMQLNNLTKASWQALRSFFYTVAKGPENQFTYTHTDGQVYTARFAMPNLTPKRANPNEFAVGLTLEVAGHVDA